MLRRRGFIFIMFGSRRIISDDAGPPVRVRCPRCHRESEMLPKSYRNWFTLFFIPIFPMGSATKFTQCAACGAQFQVSSKQLQSSVDTVDAQQSQQAIGLYNSLR